MLGDRRRSETEREKEMEIKSIGTYTYLEPHLTEGFTGSLDASCRHGAHNRAHGSLQLARGLVEGEGATNLKMIKGVNNLFVSSKSPKPTSNKPVLETDDKDDVSDSFGNIYCAELR